MKAAPRAEFGGRSCPRCERRAERMARSWGDRVVSLFMPVVRYRCVSAGCGWQGLLLRRHRRHTEFAADAYRPQWLEPSRMDGARRPPRA